MMNEEIEKIIVLNKDITFDEAVEYFKEKIPVTVKQFYEIAAEYKTLAFTVSGYTKVQVLKKFHDELLSAIEDGETMKNFKNRMNNFLEAQGYEGISNFQADNIFRTNTQTAYQVGHYKQMTEPDVLKLRPYWIYDAVNDKHTRPSHLAMDGRVFPADSPVWDIWYPPNGFRCRCTVRALSKRQVEQQKLNVENDIPKAIQLQDGSFVNVLPDPSFSTNPAKRQFNPDLEEYPDTLVNVYNKQIKDKKQ
jgi:SPP1 gp7 family putative phage head morphogenesis protein